MTGSTRVLRVFSRLNIGGPSLHVIHLSAGLTRLGFETKLVVGQVEEREGDFHDLAQQKGVAPVVLKDLGRAIRPVQDARALVQLSRIIRAFRPHVVHTHTAKAGVLGRIAAKVARVPVIVHTYHGHVLSGYFSPAMNRLFRAIERALAPVSTSLLAVSGSVKDDLVRLGVAPDARIRVLPLGLDLEPLARDLPRGTLRREAGWASEHVVVGIVGRLVPIKDVDTFIDAAVLVSNSFPNARFAVVGDGEGRERLEERATSLLGDRIRFFGWRKDTAAVFGDLDVAVNTSLNEGTPVALIEALAASVPVVATAVGGTPDLLENGAFGSLVPPRSPREVAGAITTVIASPDAARAQAAAGRTIVLRRYSVQRLIDDVAELYRSLLCARTNADGRE